MYVCTQIVAALPNVPHKLTLNTRSLAMTRRLTHTSLDYNGSHLQELPFFSQLAIPSFPSIPSSALLKKEKINTSNTTLANSENPHQLPQSQQLRRAKIQIPHEAFSF